MKDTKSDTRHKPPDRGIIERIKKIPNLNGPASKKLPILNLRRCAKRGSCSGDANRDETNSFWGEPNWFRGETNRGEINGDYV